MSLSPSPGIPDTLSQPNRILGAAGTREQVCGKCQRQECKREADVLGQSSQKIRHPQTAGVARPLDKSMREIQAAVPIHALIRGDTSTRPARNPQTRGARLIGELTAAAAADAQLHQTFEPDARDQTSAVRQDPEGVRPIRRLNANRIAFAGTSPAGGADRRLLPPPPPPPPPRTFIALKTAPPRASAPSPRSRRCAAVSARGDNSPRSRPGRASSRACPPARRGPGCGWRRR